MSSLFFYTVIYTLFVLPAQAIWLPQIAWSHVLRSNSLTLHKDVGTAPDESSTTPYNFSIPYASIIAPASTSQGMIVTSIVPIYEVCDTPGKNTTSCSTAFETITTESCSTVLTYAFTKTTISDCVHNITFSSRTIYALATTTMSALAADLQAGDIPLPTPVTYLRSTVSLYAAPWQSLAADTPGGITVQICTNDAAGIRTCVLIEEIWVVHTEYVPVITTSTLTISTSFSSDVILLLGPTQSLSVSAGNFTLPTHIENSTMSPNATTSTAGSSASLIVVEAEASLIVDPVQPLRTSTTISTRTITTTGDPTTITKTLSLVKDTGESTTTLTSTKTLTSTVTVYPIRKH